MRAEALAPDVAEPPVEERRATLRYALGVAGLTVAVDAATKLLAVALLDGGPAVAVVGSLHLVTVYNDTFARGMDIGSWAGFGAALLAVGVMLLGWRVCAPLARIDARAPLALGLVAGAALGNAIDFTHTGRGAIDFLAVSTDGGTVVFNLADVAAYLGVALLARTAVRLARAIRRERLAEREPTAAVALAAEARALRAARLEVPVEMSVAVPLFVDADVRAPRAAHAARLGDAVADGLDDVEVRYASPRRMHDTMRSANRSTSSSVV